jgi:hypothetical protein
LQETAALPVSRAALPGLVDHLARQVRLVYAST